MNADDISAWARAYVEHYSMPHVWDKDLVLYKRDNSATQWAVDMEMEMASRDPERLWAFILNVLKLDPPTDVIEVLAAGALEDYLAKLGEKVIGQVEHQAAIDPKFSALLGGVWQNNMSDAVWNRVQACWDRSGWDSGT